jgi:hypothetical protein
VIAGLEDVDVLITIAIEDAHRTRQANSAMTRITAPAGSARITLRQRPDKV